MTLPCLLVDERFTRSDGRQLDEELRYIYRTAWEAEHGPLAPGLVLHHTCENTWCRETSHLVPMTQSEHMKAHGMGGDWGQADKTHCPSGHLYNEANTYHYDRKDGTHERHCRPCHQDAKRRYRERHANACN